MSNRTKIVRRLLVLLIWMGVIFFMSNQNGDNSTNQSNFVAEILKNCGFDIIGILGDTGTFIIRKSGHLSEYFILAILFYRVFILKFSVWKTKIYAVLSTFLYACSDEIHQLFVIGREGLFRDVLIDTLGGIIGIVLLSLILKVIKKSQIQKS